MISLPALLTAGIPPSLALGTNKLQSSFGSFTAAANFIRKGKVNLKECAIGIPITAAGAVTGSVTVARLNSALISKLVPFLLLFVFIYTIVSKNIGFEDTKAKLHPLVYYVSFGLMLGFYDGFFGPGAGSRV